MGDHNGVVMPPKSGQMALLISFPLEKLVFLMFVIFLTFKVPANAVSVIPNETVLKGTVMEYCLTTSALEGIKPEQVITKLVISIEEIVPVIGYSNFLEGKEGQPVKFYSKEKQPSDLLGRTIKARVEFLGDEKGGMFWIKNIEINR